VIGNLVILGLALVLAWLISRPLRQNLALAAIVFLALLFTLQLGRVGLELHGERTVRAQQQVNPQGLMALIGASTYNAVSEFEPRLAEGLATQFAALGPDPRAKKRFRLTAERLILAAALERLPRASDEAALLYLRMRAGVLTEARQVGGETCHRQLGTDELALEWSELPAAVTEDVRKLIDEALRSSSVTPQAVPTLFEYDVTLSPVTKALRTEFGADAELLDHAKRNDPKVDKLRACNVHLAFLIRLQKLPASEASVIVRHIVSETTKARRAATMPVS
jgi:hypothetical protein